MDLNYGETLDYTYEFLNNAPIKIDNYGHVLDFGASDIEKIPRSEDNENDTSWQWAEKSSKKTPMGSPSNNTSDDSLPNADSLPTGLSADSLPTGLSTEELAKRDQQAIEFHNSQLLEGDTLVFIDYPIDSSDLKGLSFLNNPHRVHSENLLATGSAKFKKLLLSPTYQYKMLRRHKLVNKKLTGIKYVIDLTPPEEGDDALLLVANLSCSYGIQMWHTSCDRVEVMPELVSGEDDLNLAKNIAIGAVSVPRLSPSTKLTTFDDSSKSDLPNSVTSVPNSWIGNLKEANERELQRVIELSKNEAEMKTWSYPVKTQPKQPVPEYCRIRHRAGIIRLLQILEGKNPHLDSAPKIWTLFGVAEYLECIDFVKDFILQWILGNSQIIEILPEVCLKMAFGMKNQLLCRAAFAVLVSEEALSLTSREMWKKNDNQGRRNEFGRFREDVDEDIKTRVEYASKYFNERIKLEFMNLLDVNWFSDLPEFQKLQRFLEGVTSQTGQGDPKRNERWLKSVNDLISDLQNYVRGCILSAALLQLPCEMVSSIELQTLDKHRYAEMYKPDQTPPIGLFRDIYNSMDHREHIMTPFFWKILRGLEWLRPELKDMKWSFDSTPRIAEQYGIRNFSTEDVHFYRNQFNFSLMEAMSLNILGETFTDHIQVASTQPSSKANNLEAPHQELSNSQPDVAGSSKRNVDQELDAFLLNLELERLPGSTHPDVVFTNSKDQNSREFAENHAGGSYLYGNTTMSHLKSDRISPFWDLNWDTDSEKLSERDEVMQSTDITLPIRQKEDVNFRPQEKGQDLQIGISKKRCDIGIQVPVPISRPPRDIDTVESSPYFGARNFFFQVKSHIHHVCSKILSSSSMGIDVHITDTLLCLGPEEFKYLPLWAGGDDDETGGVFDPNIPTAEAGPTGPGPAYHTGFSLASAPASDDGSLMTSVDTSIGVEDGYSDNVDRRRVLSEDENDFHSETFSCDSDDYAFSNHSDFPNQLDRKGKGKAVDYFDDLHTLRSVSSSATEENAEMVSESSVAKEVGFNLGSVFDIEDNDDANTTIGEADDDEDWDGGDSETFDWGDSDEEMTSN